MLLFVVVLKDRRIAPENKLAPYTHEGVPRSFWLNPRENQAFGPYGEYTANEVARRYGASAEETTQDGDAADPSLPESEPSRYREGWLPSS